MQRVQGEITRKKKEENRQINTVKLSIDVQQRLETIFVTRLKETERGGNQIIKVRGQID